MDIPLPNSEFDADSYNYFHDPQTPVSVDLKLKVFQYNHVHLVKNDIPYERILILLSIMRFTDHVFAQFWACVNFRTTSVFTTRGQLYGHSKCTNEYSSYHIACLDHNSYVHHGQKVCIGLPGNAFLNESPIWIQNIRNYNDKLYPQQQDAKRSNIQGSIFVPLIEGSRCYGVLELAMSSFMSACSNEMREVCRALKEVGFRSWDQNETINLNTWVDYSPAVESSSTTIQNRKSKSCDITCNDITKLFGLPKEDSAKRCGISPNTFTAVHKRHGIVEWPCTRSGVAISFAHSALVYGRESEITYDLARVLERINSTVMQDNDDLICEDSLLDNYMKELNFAVGNRVGEQLDESGS